MAVNDNNAFTDPENKKRFSKSSVSMKTYVLSLCLLILVFIGWLYIFGGPYSQMYGLRETVSWLKRNKNKWNNLQKGYSELKTVELNITTAGNGCLVVIIPEPISTNARLKLYSFLLTYSINRPIKIYDYMDRKNNYKQHTGKFQPYLCKILKDYEVTLPKSIQLYAGFPSSWQTKIDQHGIIILTPKESFNAIDKMLRGIFGKPQIWDKKNLNGGQHGVYTIRNIGCFIQYLEENDHAKIVILKKTRNKR